MSEISIILPYSALAGLSDLTPQGIIDEISKLDHYKIENQALRGEVERLRVLVNSAGRELDNILKMFDGMERARALRTLAKELFEMFGEKK